MPEDQNHPAGADHDQSGTVELPGFTGPHQIPKVIAAAIYELSPGWAVIAASCAASAIGGDWKILADCALKFPGQPALQGVVEATAEYMGEPVAWNDDGTVTIGGETFEPEPEEEPEPEPAGDPEDEDEDEGNINTPEGRAKLAEVFAKLYAKHFAGEKLDPSDPQYDMNDTLGQTNLIIFFLMDKYGLILEPHNNRTSDKLDLDAVLKRCHKVGFKSLTLGELKDLRNKNYKSFKRGQQESMAAAEAARDTDPRPKLEADTVEIGETAGKLRALLGEKHLVFSYGDFPVTITTGPVPRLWADRERKIPLSIARPTVLNVERATCAIDQVARWIRVRQEIPTPAPTPAWAAAQIANGGVSMAYAPLAGVLRHPAVAPGNKLVFGQTGYDPETGFYMDAAAPDGIGHVWSSPKEALDWLLLDWLGEFAFATKGDAYRALMIATTLLKARLTIADAMGQKWPGFFATAPDAGTGKTEMVECIVLAVTGTLLPFATFPRDNEEEMAKILLGIALADPAAFCFDNIKNGATIYSESLDRYITRQTFTGRKLGVNDNPEAPALAVPTATGNNIEAREDAASRWLEIRMIREEEDPHRHVYERNIKGYTLANRGKIISALHAIAAVPTSIPPGERFPVWFSEVAAPMMELTNDRTLLDQWREPTVTTANAENLARLLARLHAKKAARAPDPAVWRGFYASEIVADEAALEAVSGLIPGITMETVAACEPPDQEWMKNAPMQEVKVACKAHKAACGKASAAIGRSLNRYKDKAAGGFRLRVNKGTGHDRHECQLYDVEPAFKPKQDDPEGPD